MKKNRVLALIILVLFNPVFHAILLMTPAGCMEVKRIGPNPSFTSIPPAKAFFHRLYPKWISVFHVEILNEHFVNTPQSIIGPERTWQKLLRLDHLGPGDFSKFSQCLFYRLPSLKLMQYRHQNDQKAREQILQSRRKGHFGQVKVVDIDKDESCDLAYLKESETTIKNVVNLMVLLTDHGPLHHPTAGRIKPYTLALHLDILDLNSKQLRFFPLEFTLYNVKKGRLKLNFADKKMESSRLTERYSPSVEQKAISGVTVFSLKRPVPFGSEIKEGTITPHLGRYQDNYADGNLVKCHEVNDECETIQEFTCDRCRYGWFETTGSGCPSGGTKFCGLNACGLPRQPACPRGHLLSSDQGMVQCQNGSMAGFCQNNAETFCDGGNILICP